MEGLREIEVQGSVQYIVVKFGDEQFGIDIKYIDNIVRMQRITRVPKVQNFIKGVIRWDWKRMKSQRKHVLLSLN